MLKNTDNISYFDNDVVEIKKIITKSLEDKNKNTKSLINNLPAVEGKMIRAIMVMIGGSFGKIDKTRLYNISAAVEVLHLATLVHDDIVDESDLRRGKITINASHGTKVALFLGDYLVSEAYILFAQFSSAYGLLKISKTVKTICRGEIDQFLTKYCLNCSIKEYFKRINSKCASLFSLSLFIGAYESGASKDVIHTLEQIGYYFGMTFQLIDDILDITRERLILGKPSENDVKEGIYSFPIIYELRNNNESLKSAIEQHDYVKTFEILKNSEGLVKAKEVAEKFTSKALLLIGKLPDIEEKIVLKNITKVLLNRAY